MYNSKFKYLSYVDAADADAESRMLNVRQSERVAGVCCVSEFVG